MCTSNFSWPVTSMDQADYEAFCRWFSENSEKLSTHKLVIWGAGIRGTLFLILLKERGIHNVVFIDSNPKKQGGHIDEYPIFSPDAMKSQREEENVLILVSAENSLAIQRELESWGCQRDHDYFLIEAGQYEAYVQEFLRPYGQDTLIMGDCEFSTVSIKDIDRSTLQDKLFQRCGQNSTKILAMHGMGLRAEYNIFHAQILQNMKPKRLVIMVNFDTLTGKQHLLPRSQHVDLLKRLIEVQATPAEEFVEYARIAEERSCNLQTEIFAGREKAEATTVIKARNYLRLNYMYVLDTATEGVVYLQRILDEALSANVAVLPFVPPVNYQLAGKLFGDVFNQKYCSNLEKIREVVHSRGIPLLDLSFCMEADLFASEMTANETANSIGREKVADLLFAAIQEMK